MNFTELCNEVILITKRPDLLALTQSAVRTAILKAHQKDFFYRDIIETGVEFPGAEFVTSFRPLDIIPNFRKPAYLREWCFDSSAPNQGRPGKQFSVIEPGNARDSYGYYKKDVYYLAGDLLQIRSATPLTHALFGAYVLPNITTTGEISWITREYPYAVIHAAARQVFKTIGASEQATTQDEMAAEAYAILTINSIPQEGN